MEEILKSIIDNFHYREKEQQQSEERL